MAETYRIDLLNTLSPEIIYAERQKRKDEQDWQNLLGGPQGTQAGEGSLGAAPAQEKPSAIAEGAQKTLDTANAGASQVFDALFEIFSLGTSPGAGTPMATMTKLVQGLGTFGIAIPAGLSAAGGQALLNAHPDVAEAPIATGGAAAALRGLIQGTNLQSMTPDERQAMFAKPFTVKEAIDTALPLLIGAGIPKIPGALKKAGELNTKLGERGSVTMPPEPGAAGGAQRPTTPGSVSAEGAVPGESRLNTTRFDASERVQTVMTNISKLNTERMAESRRTQSHGETQGKAADLGMSLEDAIALDPNAVSLNKIPETGTALAKHFADAAAYLEEVDRQYNEVRTPETAAQLFDAFAVAAELIAKDEGLGTGLGRGLESRKIKNRAERGKYSAEQIAAIAQNTQNSPNMSADALSGMLNTLTPAQRKTFLKQAGSGMKVAGQSIYEFYINGLLSNPVSHAANFTSNLLMLPVYLEERAVAGVVRALKRGAGELGLKKVMPSWAKDAPGVELTEATNQVLALQQGMLDGYAMALESWKEEKQAFGGGKVEHEPSITAENWGLAPGVVADAVDYLGTGVRLPTRAMATMDTFFKGVSYRAELAAQAAREASREGLTGADAKSRIAEIYHNAEHYPQVKAAAEQQALINTFNNALGPAGESVSKALDKTVVGRAIFPFYRTPTNIWKQTYYRVPILGALSFDFFQAIAEGGPRADLALGRQATGGLIAAGIAGLVAAERITGARPKNPTEAAAWEAQGKKEYSILLDGNWYAYNRGSEPIGTTMGVIADYTQIVGRLPVDDADLDKAPLVNAVMNHPLELAFGIKLAMTNLMLNQSYLMQANTILKALNDEEAAAKRVLKGYLQGAMPFSGAMRFATRTTDDAKRDTGALTEMQEILNSFKEITPGFSSTLPPLHHHITGEVMHYPAGVVPGNTSLFAYTQHFPTTLMQEIEDNQVSLPKPTRWILGTKPNTSGLEFQEAKPGEGTYLSGEEYQAFLVHLTKGTEISGRTLLEGLEHVVESDTYQRLSPGPGGSRKDMLETIYNAYRQKAVQSFLKLPDNEELQQQVKAQAEKKINAKRPVTSPKSPSYGKDVAPGSLTR